jgi:hypothetical protein
MTTRRASCSLRAARRDLHRRARLHLRLPDSLEVERYD